MNGRNGDDETDGSLDLSLLSPREREVLAVALEGISGREIALRLSVTEATVRSHLAAIYSKLGVSGRVELLARHQSANRQGTEAEPVARHPSAHSPRRFPGRALLLVASIGALLILGVLVVAFRPSPSTDLSTVSDLVAADGIAAIDVHGSTLAALDRSGGRLHVDRVPAEELARIVELAARHSVPVTVSSARPDLAESLLMPVTALLPFALVATLVAIGWKMRRGTPAARGG